MNALPSIGSWVWGCSGNVCQVVDIGTKRSTGQTMLKVDCCQGQRVIPLDAVKGMALDKSQPLKLGERVWVAPINAVGIIAQLDHDTHEARVNDIEGFNHPVTGYEVLSQWFPYACLEMIEAQQVTA